MNLIDLGPTLLALLGLPACPPFQGVSAVPASRERPWVFLHSFAFVVQDGLVERPWKLLWTRWPEEKVELYNLAEDPGERVDLYGRESVIAFSLQQRLAKWRRVQLQYHLLKVHWQFFWPPRYTLQEWRHWVRGSP